MQVKIIELRIIHVKVIGRKTILLLEFSFATTTPKGKRRKYVLTYDKIHFAHTHTHTRKYIKRT